MNILDIAIAKKLAGGGGGSGTDNYNDLSNLPKINDTTLSGNKSSSALGLQSEITSDSKLASDLVDDTNQDNKFVTSTEKQTWNAKQNAIDNSHKLSSDLVDDTNHTNKFVTSTEKQTWNAKQNAIDNSHKLSSDLVDDTNHTNKFVTSTEKQTWNAKQNAIDADHKLSSSLVSFTTAEAAALASGIDSSKVGQISTNQTNILYAANRVGKNVIRTQRAYDTGYSTTVKGITYTVQDDYSIKVNGTCTASTGDYSTFVITSSALHADDNYGHEISGFTLNGCPNLNGDLWIAIERRDSPYTNYGFDNGSNASGVTINTIPTGVDILVFVRVSSGKTINNAVVYPMIRPAFTDSTYQPPSAPNSDLTQLEAEDRAELIDLVDSGAKQLLQFNNDTSGQLVATVQSDGYTVKVTGGESTGKTVTYATASISKTGLYALKVDLSGTGASCYLYDATTSTQIKEFYASTEEYFTLTAGHTYNIKTYRAGTGTNATIALLLCTKAAFCLSPKFVPYVPNMYDYQWQAVSTYLLARRSGRTVTLNGYIANISFTANTATLIGNINTTIGRPHESVRTLCNVGANAYTVGTLGYLILQQDGNIYVTTAYEGTGAVYVSLSYTI